MTARERVVATLRFSNPDRIPRDLWTLPYIPLFREDELDAVLQRYPSDIDRPELSPGSSAEEMDRLARPGTYTDEWGSVWKVGEPGIVGEVKRPALADWTALEDFEPPWNVVRERDLSEANQACRESDKFMLSAVCARPFERLQFLRGSENVYLDLATGCSELMELLRMVHEFYLEDVRVWADSEVDGVLLMDDWGTNQSLLIRPDRWRQMFKPLYREYCEIIHGAGKYAFFHSDGHIEAIYGDLIEVGMDAINSQLFRMDIEDLADRYRGKVTFWGEIDRQHVLPFGSPEDVHEAVRRVHRALGGEEGGVIAQCEWGKDNPQENVEAVFKAWDECAG
jgi:hypothetical protein